MSDYLIHYNHNHDALGRFARSAGSVGRKITSSVGKNSKNNNTRKFESSKRKAADMKSSRSNKSGKKVEVIKANEAIAKNKSKGAKSNNTKLSDSERKRLVESGSAKEISKNKDKLSNRELETAINRLQKEKINRVDLEKKLSDLASPENQKTKKTAVEKLENMTNTTNKLINTAETGIKAWNTIAKIHNARNPSDKWVVVGEKGGEKKDKPRSWVEDIAKRGDAEAANRNFSKMTNDEAQYVDDRLKQKSMISGYANKERERKNEAFSNLNLNGQEEISFSDLEKIWNIETDNKRRRG